MHLTYFNSKETKGKTPLSPFDDLTFQFNTIEVSDLTTMYRYMVKNFILNLPLCKSLKTFRRKSVLKDHCSETFDYVILDFNDITTKENQIKIIKYFKEYKCILGESRSNNGIDNFNLKGILCIKSIKLNNLKRLIDQLKYELIDYGTLDVRVSSISSVSAPIERYNILLESNGKLYEYHYSAIDKTVPVNIHLDSHLSTEELCLKVFESLGFRVVSKNGNCINFEHESEETKGGYYWFKDSPFIMHHYDESNSVNIYSSVIKLPEFKNITQKVINYSECLNSLTLNTYIHKVNQKYIEVDNTIRDMICRFLNDKENLFVIKSPMGTGKSSVISSIIDEAKEMDMRILVCTNRISVANDSLSKYKLKIYNKDIYYTNDSIIVQYDSLYKYDIKKFDIVIFDEFISLLLHTRNNMSNILKNMLNFFACFKKKLVIADAFLTGYENFFLDNKSYVYMIDNDYRDDTNTYEYTDFNFFVRSLLLHTKKHKITVSSTSTKIIYALKKILEQYNLRVYTLVSNTPQALKDKIYSNFNNSEPFYDVLIYSPTLTVGVSNLNNIDIHFHYDCSKSCDVISSLQMLKRTRKAKEIHFYVKNQVQYLKTSYSEIKDDYVQNLNKQNDYNCFFEYNEYGETRLSNLGKRSIQIDVFKNILEFSHKNAFTYLLKYQFSKEPIKIEDKFCDNVLLPYIKEIKTNNENFYDECFNDYVSLSKIDKDLVSEDKKNVFNILHELENSIKYNTDINVKNEILKIGLKDNTFFNKILKYKIVFSYQNNIIKRKDIQNIIATSLLNNIDNATYWNTFLNFESKIDKVYNVKTVMSNNKLKTILEGCGYIKCIENGLCVYKVDENVEKYKDYVKDYEC